MLLALALGGSRSFLYEQHTLGLIGCADVYAMLWCSVYVIVYAIRVLYSTTPVSTLAGHCISDIPRVSESNSATSST